MAFSRCAEPRRRIALAACLVAASGCATAAAVRPSTRAEQQGIESAIAASSAAEVEQHLNRRFFELLLDESAPISEPARDATASEPDRPDALAALERSFVEQAGMTPLEILRESSRRAAAASGSPASATPDSLDDMAQRCHALLDRRLQSTAARVVAAAQASEIAVAVVPGAGASARALRVAPADARSEPASLFPNPLDVVRALARVPARTQAALGIGLTNEIHVGPEMVLVAANDDQLACLVAHEVAHLELGHPDAALWIGHGKNVVGMAGETAVGSMPFAGALLNALLQTDRVVEEALVGAPLRVAGRDRAQEFAADRTGQELVARAGYDPAACADLVLASARHASIGASGSTDAPAWWREHPPSVERILFLRERAADLRASAGS
jgi:Zn-dependent protease with chaperone function